MSYISTEDTHESLVQAVAQPPDREKRKRTFVAVRLLTWHRLKGWLHTIVPVQCLLHFAEGIVCPLCVAYISGVASKGKRCSAEEQAV